MDETRFFEDLDARLNRTWPIGIAREPIYPHGPVALTASLRIWAQTDPHRIAIDYYGTRFDYLELDRLSDRCATVLSNHGVREGDRVAVLLDNCPQFAIAFFGILKLGAVYVPISPRASEAELIRILDDAEAVSAIASNDCAPSLVTIQSRTTLESIFSTGETEFMPAMSALSLPEDITLGSEPPTRTIDFLTAIRSLSDVRQWPDADLDAVAALNYTSGTTGVPRGCMHTQRNMQYVSAVTMATSGNHIGRDKVDTPPTVFLWYLPLSWIVGQVVGLMYPVFSGSTVVLLNRWHPHDALRAIDRCRVQRCFMSVDKVIEIIDHPMRARYSLDSLKASYVASLNRKLSPQVRRQWEALTGSTISEGAWGMTETHTMNTFTTNQQEADRDLEGLPIFVGLPMPGTRIKICDFETGALRNIGEIGEIVIKSPSLFKGYWRQPEETAKTLRNGWFHTGDIGAYDESGALRYFGRHRELLKVRGMAVFPRELEALISRHDAVVNCAVLGRPDPEHGQVPVAFVHVDNSRSSTAVTAESLRNWCRERMAIHKMPEIRLVEALPITRTGKVRKYELEARLRNDAGSGAHP